MENSLYKDVFKRLVDIVFSILALITLSPIIVFLSIIIRFKLGKGIIFKQDRPGLNGCIFTLYKFRTMTNLYDENGVLLPDCMRMTSFGKFLRSTSLDELPELINIIRGDMSIVGPRPQLVKDLVFMSEEVKKRHSVRPGLTGLAQINGRNIIAWEDKFHLDLEYIKNISLKNDVCIIVSTFFKVLKKSDINSNGFITSEDYGDYLLRIGKISREYYDEIINSLSHKEYDYGNK